MKNNSAASILYAIVITTIVIVTAGAMSASFIRATQRNHDLFRSTQAHYAARAAMEEGLAAASLNGGLGYEFTSLSNAVSWPSVDSTGQYSIYSLSKRMGWQNSTPPGPGGFCNPVTAPADCYVVPMPGTGTAGGDTCEFTDPTQPWASNLDDDCNWNKIEYQETVSIPLYYEGCPDGYCNPAETGQELNDLIVRVRVPFTGPGPGPSLDGTTQVIMKWEISGECDTTGDGVGDTTCYMEEKEGGVLDSMTTAQKINIAPQYTILTEANEVIDTMSPSSFSMTSCT